MGSIGGMELVFMKPVNTIVPHSTWNRSRNETENIDGKKLGFKCQPSHTTAQTSIYI